MPSVSRRTLLRVGGAAVAANGIAARLLAAPVVSADLIVYGATSGGLVAAIQARRMSRTAVVLEPSTHLGGLTTGGLGQTDSGVGGSIKGIAGEFYRRIHAAYAGTPVTPTSPARFTFEPHVARAVFDAMLLEAGVAVYFGVRIGSVTKSGNRLLEVVGDNGQAFRGGMFVDASYEGDLMDRAGVACTVGRESNATYGETINGVQLRSGHQFNFPVSPYVVAGNPSSGLLQGVSPTPVAPTGSGDGLIQAYNYRMCLTQAASRLPFPRPAGYDAVRYELLLRYIQAGWNGPFFTTHGVGNGKTDSNNNGAFSTDFIGANYAYPTASYAARESIAADHRTYQQGLMWLLANDPRVPAPIRAATASWGLAADEFTATGGWPPQLYVREARRMLAAFVMTERECRGQAPVADPVGLASYTMDSHNCQRVVVGGAVRNEGDVQVGVPGPYGISYRSIVPIESQCANLLVPVCLSASHIAYGSIRMEPVFMILGQSAATAAVLALSASSSVQQVPYATLRARLLADGQLLQWPPPAGPGEVIVDSHDPSVTRAGTWVSSTSIGGYWGSDYEHDGNTAKGVNRLRFRPNLPSAGTYTVYLRWTADPNRASNVPVDVVHSGGITTRVVDQRGSGGQWVSLGAYACGAGTSASLLIRTENTNGYVIADAARWVLTT